MCRLGGLVRVIGVLSRLGALFHAFGLCSGVVVGGVCCRVHICLMHVLVVAPTGVAGVFGGIWGCVVGAVGIGARSMDLCDRGSL